MTRESHAGQARLVVSIVLLLVMPPLGPIAWIALSGPDRGAYLRSRLVRAGAAVVLLPMLPMLWVIATTPSGLSPAEQPNPVGLGLLAVAGALAGTVLLMSGTLMTFLELRRRG